MERSPSENNNTLNTTDLLIKKLRTVKTILLMSSILLILIWSCRRVVIVDSSAEIISRSIDVTLNDSALIYGFVYDAGDKDLPLSGVDIWIEGSDFKTISDNQGKFNIKVSPGIYTIKCLYPRSDERFTAVIKNVTLLPNEKIEIRFYHGNMSE
jgi:hypothetical protein